MKSTPSVAIAERGWAAATMSASKKKKKGGKTGQM